MITPSYPPATLSYPPVTPGYPPMPPGYPPMTPGYPPVAPLAGKQPSPLLPPQPWRIKFPAVISGILAAFQLLITIGVIGCEVGSILIDMVTSTIYVGFWAGLFFIFASVSLAASSCCCRTCGCATYALAMQCICLVFASCIIGFDAYFLSYPSTCFFPSSTCIGLGTYRGLFYSQWNFNNVKTPLIIGQLAAAGVMFVLCLIYIAIYIITAIRVHKAKTPPAIYPQTPYTMPAVPTGPDGMIMAPPMTNVRPTRAASPLYHRPTMVLDNGEGRTNDLLCPTCSTMMAVSVRKRPPQ